ncbi:MAG: hypothetical protein ABOK23_08615 [Candidatus Methanoperedens sp.]|nr:hypothetical protein [Candidatus Methanoperedens sp.]MCZ7396426.1 hypothetical protein [Candidatus Methanoperedens sp.]
MELKIENIDLLLPKKVPKHGKVSGIKSERGSVRIIIPSEKTKLSLTVSEPSEMLVRSVTPDGKLLGLTNFIGKNIFIIAQEESDFRKETGLVNITDNEDENVVKELLKLCEKENIDPADLIRKTIKDMMSKGSKK